MKMDPSRGQLHCDKCQDSDYRPAPINSIYTGIEEYTAGEFADPFEGLTITRSAADYLKGLRQYGGRRWDGILALLRDVATGRPKARTHRQHDSPVVHETYLKTIDEHRQGIRIYWISEPMIIIAARHYPLDGEPS